MIVKSSRDLNTHVRADEHDTNVHYPKGFLTALKGNFSHKGHDDNLKYSQRLRLENVLNIVDGMVVPPTETDGACYILQKKAIYFDVDTILWISGNTIEYTFAGNPDLSKIAGNDYLRIRDAGKIINNGNFIITNVYIGTYKIRITNTNRTDATDNETSPSPATATWTAGRWDGCGDCDHVKYFASEDKWYGITPEKGVFVLNLDDDKLYVFLTDWVGVETIINLPAINTEFEIIAPGNTGKDQLGNWKFLIDVNNNLCKYKCTAPGVWEIAEMNTFFESP